MSTHLLILVHGVGLHPKEWADPYIKQLRAAYTAIPSLNLLPFDQAITVKSIVYDQFFEFQRQAWRDNAKKVIDKFKAAGLSKSGVTALLKANERLSKDDFLGTHVLDVLQYRFMKTVAEQVRSHVATQIEKLVQEHDPQHRANFSVLGHSLGTAVVTEAMHCWMTDDVGDMDRLTSRLTPDNLFMVANCARLLWSLGPPKKVNAIYGCATFPFPTNDHGACRYFGNYAHSLDPITQPLPFDPPKAEFFHTPQRNDVYGNVDIHPEDVQKFNVHALEHYLAHPDVHIDLFRRIRRSLGLVTEEERRKALEDYFGTTLVGKKLAEARQQLAEFTSGDTEKLDGVVERLMGFLRAI